MSVPTGVLVEGVSTELRQWEEDRKESERGSERVGFAQDAQEGKRVKEQLKQGYETKGMTGRLVAWTGALSWPFARGCDDCPP